MFANKPRFQEEQVDLNLDETVISPKLQSESEILEQNKNQQVINQVEEIEIDTIDFLDEPIQQLEPVIEQVITNSVIEDVEIEDIMLTEPVINNQNIVDNTILEENLEIVSNINIEINNDELNSLNASQTLGITNLNDTLYEPAVEYDDNYQIVEPTPTKKRKGPRIFLIIIILLIIALAASFFLFKDKIDLSFLNPNKNLVIKNSLTKSGIGLYEDDTLTALDSEIPFSSNYYFKGIDTKDKDVNNFIKVENSCFRIVNMTSKNEMKIIYYGPSENNKCSTENNNLNKDNELIMSEKQSIWIETDIYKYLEEIIKSNELNGDKIDFTSKDSYFIEADWYSGAVRFVHQNLSADIYEERRNTYNDVETPVNKSKIGLLNVTDYLKVSCGRGAWESVKSCKDDNYLYKKNKNIWTMTPSSVGYFWAIKEEGNVNAVKTDATEYEVIPVFYLKSNLSLTGLGTSKDPYTIK